MNVKELEERIDLLQLIQSKYATTRTGNTYRVNPCPVCGHKEHFTVYPETNSYSSFNSCCKGGSVYKYLLEVEEMIEEEAYNKLLELAGEAPSVRDRIQPTKPKDIQPETAAKTDYTETILELYNNQPEAGKEYFKKRGISPEIIDKYKLSIGSVNKLYDKYNGTRAIIPIWEAGNVVYWNARALEATPQIKYLKAPGSSTYFNIDHLREASEGETIVITEGEFDALSLETIGIRAIAIGGVQNYENLTKLNTRKDLNILTAFDNDEKGQQYQGTNKIKIPEQYKDLNEWLQLDRASFETSIPNQIQTLKNPDTLFNYMQGGLMADITRYKQFKNKKTGYKYLDEITSLYPGLYVIGGLSTLGKTTFIHQMADQIAEQGEHVIFFSLEMAKLELITKSLARLTVFDENGHNFSNGVNALQIRLNDIPSEKRNTVQAAIKNYAEISKRFSVVEGNFDTNITTIREYVERYTATNKVNPVVIIDYLQIIPGREQDRSDKERIDGVVTELKRISRDYNIPVIVVSSLNRQNYLTPIDFESFKESGGIEYTADVIWGLQLQAVTEELFNSQGDIKKKRERITEAKKASPRKIDLVCLKNRNGISNYTCSFDYYPKYDVFVDVKANIQR